MLPHRLIGAYQPYAPLHWSPVLDINTVATREVSVDTRRLQRNLSRAVVHRCATLLAESFQRLLLTQ